MMMQAAPGQPVVIVGAGGHARVLQASLVVAGWTVLGAVERDGALPAPEGQPPVLGGEALIATTLANTSLVIGVGAVPSRAATGLAVRRRLYEWLAESVRERLITVLDPAAIIRGDVEIGHAAQVLAGAIIQPGTQIGTNVVANTGCRIDHDCLIEDHSFIGPGAILCGRVCVGSGSFIGAGAILLPGVKLGPEAIVAAGAIVTCDVAEGACYGRRDGGLAQ